MDFEFVDSSPVPSGNYRAEFLGAEPMKPNDYGTSARFTFRVLKGEHAERTTSCLASIDRPPSARNKLGKILGGLAGKAIEAGEKLNSDDFVGQEYLIAVVENKNGNTSVDTILPADVG